MIILKLVIGTLIGTLYFFAVSGWRKNQSLGFKARRITGWTGLILAELMFISMSYPNPNNQEISNDLSVDLTFAFISWLFIAVPISVVVGVSTYFIYRILQKKT